MICQCGQEIETTGTSYTFATYNDKGEVIYAICMHGIVVIDKRDEDYTEGLG